MEVDALNKPKRRCGSRDVTPHACTECRKKRTKCDGQTPCGRCVSHKVECIYEIPVRISKEEMRRELEELRKSKSQHEKLLAALVSGDSSSLLLEKLRDGLTLQKLDCMLPEAAHLEKEPPQNLEPKKWTTVTSDEGWIDHLMALYFSWEYPIFAPFSKEHFLEDYKSGNERYCSSLLVNSLLAVACRFYFQSKSRSYPDESSTAGDQFFEEALRLLEEEKNPQKLTTIQSLGLMSIRQASCDRPDDGFFYSGQSVRLAVEMGLQCDVEPHHISEVEYVVRSATFWGSFCLDEAWSICLGRIPHFSESVTLLKKPQSFQHAETIWTPFTGENADHNTVNRNSLSENRAQKSDLKGVFRAFCGLSEIVHKSLYALYSPHKIVTSSTLLARYSEYLNWYDQIPANLRSGDDSTPAVLFLHICPHTVCGQAVAAISTIMKSYSKLYSLCRTPTFLPYCLIISSITDLLVLGDPETGLNTLSQYLADLKNMLTCHCFANRTVQILRHSADIRILNLGSQIENGRDQDVTMRETRDLQACSCQHVLASSNPKRHYLPNMKVSSEIDPAPLGQTRLFWTMQCRSFEITEEMLRNFGFSAAE